MIEDRIGASASSSEPLVTVAVTSFNTRDTTRECVIKVLESTGIGVEVIVVDNGSTDGSAGAVRSIDPRVRVIALDSNRGFGFANNVAWRAASGQYLLLLNSDAWVNRDTVSAAVGLMERKARAGAVACQLRNLDGSIQRSCRRFPSAASEVTRALLPSSLLYRRPLLGRYFMSDWDHQGVRVVDQPAGAFLLLRPASWGEGPPFDERFFMFYEDVDLCRRIWREGYSVWFTDASRLVHLRETATATDRSAMAVALAQSRICYFRKWQGAGSASIVGFANVVGSILRSMTWVLIASRRGRKAEALDRSVAHWKAAVAGARCLVTGRPSKR
jgi:GT2 family glycosyltransferase